MSLGITDTQNYSDIANAIRAKNGSADTYTPSQMATAISNIPSTPTITLPPEYQKVDYLTSTGTQRIESGLYNNTAITPVQYEFGVKYSATSSRQLQGSQGAFYIGVVNNKWQIGQGGTTASKIDATADTWYDVSYYCDGNNSSSHIGKGMASVKVQNTETPLWCSSYDTIQFDYNNNYQICVFSLNQQNIPSTCSVSYFKIWQNGTLLRHFIPCYRIADGVIGMYDIVGEQFYTNAGTGDFTCYPAVPS